MYCSIVVLQNVLPPFFKYLEHTEARKRVNDVDHVGDHAGEHADVTVREEAHNLLLQAAELGTCKYVLNHQKHWLHEPTKYVYINSFIL